MVPAATLTANHASAGGQHMQQNDAAPVFILQLHGSVENYVLAVFFKGRALTCFQLLQSRR
jgi:hypothetical protein